MASPEGEALWLWLGTAGMFLGMVYFIARGWGVKNERRQKFYIATIFITAIAFANYLAMALGYGLTTVVVGGEEIPIYWARYTDWLFTTPLLLYDLGLLAGADRNTIYTLVGLDVAMIGTGAVATLTGDLPGAALSTGAQRLIWWGVSTAFLLVLLVSIGFMAEEVGGIHPAVVAFALGLVLSEVVDAHDEVEDKLKGIVFSFFAPIFFLHAGTKFEPELISLQNLGVASLLFVVACSLKYLGTAIPAQRLLALPGRYVGILFNYRLSFGIIAATVGLNMAVLTRELYAIVLLVVMLSAALPVILLRDRPTEFDMQ